MQKITHIIMRKFLLLIGIICLSGVAKGQTTMDSLMRYKWEYIEEGEEKIVNSFKIFDQYTCTFIDRWLDDDGSEDGDVDIDTYSYYLVPIEPVRSFDDSKVGKNKNGQAIVVKKDATNYWLYFIESLTDNSLTITSMPKGGPLITTKWKAIPRDN